MAYLCCSSEPEWYQDPQQRLYYANKWSKQTRVAFQAILQHKPSFVSFSQRKFYGFKNRIEFDQKRILIATGNRITILGLHPQSERPFEILNCQVPGLERENLYRKDRQTIMGGGGSYSQFDSGSQIMI